MRKIVLIGGILYFPHQLFAEIPATTNSGDKVILHEDGTWEYLKDNGQGDWKSMLGLRSNVLSGDGYQALLVSAGTFQMGCTPEQRGECDDDEKPAHTVTISNDFYVMKSEVSQGLFRELMRNNPSKYSDCGSDCPVDSVSWYDAIRFANALSAREGLEQCYRISDSRIDSSSKSEYVSGETATVTWPSGLSCRGWRLPTEAEWEYAARGGERTLYSGSHIADEVAWYEGSTRPVCSKKSNGYGLCDMSGNVGEWAWDWKKNYTSSSQTDPKGPYSGESRAIRGGSVSFGGEKSVRISSRDAGGPAILNPICGFRLVKTAN